jgi:hypothetical protein
MLLVNTTHEKRYTGVRSGMSSGAISQSRYLWGRQMLELPSKDDDQQLCGTEGQGQELPHDESTSLVDEETSDHLTEEQYNNILEMLTKVRVVLETANYARQMIETGASIQRIQNTLQNTLRTKQQSSWRRGSLSSRSS